MFYKNLDFDNLCGEVWKDIKDFNGIYQISNFGRVKSLIKEKKSKNGIVYKLKPRIMKQAFSSTGYLLVNLNKKVYKVHRLVAEAFLKKDQMKNYVNHKDFNTLNNCVDNLEWCTQKENVEWNVINNRNNRYILDSEKEEIKRLYKDGISIKTISKKLGVSITSIYLVLKKSNLSRVEYKRKSKYIPINELKELFNKGLKNKEISELYNIPSNYVARRKYQIKKGEI